MSTEQIIQLLDNSVHQPGSTPVLYPVKAGDTLSQIIADYYDIHYGHPQYKITEASIAYFNDLDNPDYIRSGQLLRLLPLPSPEAVQACEMPEDFNPYTLPTSTTWHLLEPMSPGYARDIEHYIPLDPAEQEAFWTIAWWDYTYPFLSNTASGGMLAVGGIVGESNTQLLAQVKRVWEQYQSGLITQSQYNYQRQQLLKQYKELVGPFERLIFKNQSVNEAIRINRTKALPATHNIDIHAARIGQLARAMKYGGVVLSAASLGVGCYQIANTEDYHEKNEIFVETMASTGWGLLVGGVVTAMLISNPVGWGIALV